MKKEEVAAVRDILKYIQGQPNAVHTIEGIAKYWIFQQRLEERLDHVIHAIDYLAKRGFLNEVKKANGGSYYKVNKKKLKDIPGTLSDLRINHSEQ
ncbi:MAG: hypothetical protein ACE5I1_16690 [bacterium]